VTDVVVTGRGVVTSLGEGADAFFTALLDRRSGIADGVGPCADFDVEDYMSPREARRIDRFSQFALAAADQAWAEAGLADADFDDARVGGRFTETWGCGARVGLIPIGGGRVYSFVSMSGDSQHETDFERRFARWHDPIPDVIAATPRSAWSATPILWRKPLRDWGRGNITLLGDAAHPMTPDIGQGAGQALEDAVVLAARVRDAHDVPAALRAYERERVARTTPIARRSRQVGRVASASHRVTCALRDRMVAATPASAQERQQRAILDYALPEL
jgi:2-polyprenyl-6-methoxyphenol hydroxylase-like FAD-dependent oxidoreductase